MVDYKNPEMQEIIQAFCEESNGLIRELSFLLEKLEDEPENGQYLEKFGQIIDRIMGAADSLGLTSIGSLAKMGKVIGYKASQTDEIALRELTTSILFDTIETISQMIVNLQNQQEPAQDISLSTLNGRLKWLADKFKHIKRSSVGFDE